MELGSINFAEVMRDLEALQQKVPEGFTVYEMMQATGHGSKWCRDRLRILIENGKIKFNGKKRILNISGGVSITNVYITVGY